MRLSSLVVGLALVSPAAYAQLAPAPAPTPAPATHTAPSSPPSTAGSASSSSHNSSPSSSASSSTSSSPSMHSPSPASSSTSSSNHSGGFAGGGFGSSSSHGRDAESSSSRHEKESSHDAARESKSSRETSSHEASNHETSKHETASENKPAHDSNATSVADTDARNRRDDERGDRGNDSRITGGRERDAAGEDGARHDERGPSDGKHPDPAGKASGDCAKEPCATASPKVSHVDWVQGRCQSGPCEACAKGSSPNKFGYCVANVPTASCASGTVWNGKSCVSASATAASAAPNGAAAPRGPQCIAIQSQVFQINTDLGLARHKVFFSVFQGQHERGLPVRGNGRDATATIVPDVADASRARMQWGDTSLHVISAHFFPVLASNCARFYFLLLAQQDQRIH